jgi:hypothetical protein
MYWVVIACVILVDNFFGWFLSVYHPQLQHCRTPVLISIVFRSTRKSKPSS